MGRHEQRIKELVLSRVTKCGQCGGDYGVSDVNVLGHKEDLWFLMLICAHCHQAVGVAAVVKELSSPLSKEGDEPRRREGRRRRQADKVPAAPTQPLTKDDVADMRAFLTGFDGDFKGLFDKKVQE
jgi:hypothetical protein